MGSVVDPVHRELVESQSTVQKSMNDACCNASRVKTDAVLLCCVPCDEEPSNGA